jgi:hypothetical protein
MRLLLLICCLTVASLQATVILQFTTPTEIANPGQTITFGGTIVNNFAQTVDLNGINVSIPGMFSFDGSPFFDLSAPLSVGPNSSTAVYDWFTITIDDPYTDPFGMMDGTLTLLGGIQGPNGYDPSVFDVIATATFSINVQPAPVGSPVPEPSSLLPLATVALAFVVRRGKTKAALLSPQSRGPEGT